MMPPTPPIRSPSGSASSPSSRWTRAPSPATPPGCAGLPEDPPPPADPQPVGLGELAVEQVDARAEPGDARDVVVVAGDPGDPREALDERGPHLHDVAIAAALVGRRHAVE